MFGIAAGHDFISLRLGRSQGTAASNAAFDDFSLTSHPSGWRELFPVGQLFWSTLALLQDNPREISSNQGNGPALG
jgi:hypothetical protein